MPTPYECAQSLVYDIKMANLDHISRNLNDPDFKVWFANNRDAVVQYLKACFGYTLYHCMQVPRTPQDATEHVTGQMLWMSNKTMSNSNTKLYNYMRIAQLFEIPAAELLQIMQRQEPPQTPKFLNIIESASKPSTPSPMDNWS